VPTTTRQDQVNMTGGTQVLPALSHLHIKGIPVFALAVRLEGLCTSRSAVETASNLTKKQHELLSEFEKLSSGATPQPESRVFPQGQGLSFYLLRQPAPTT